MLYSKWHKQHKSPHKSHYKSHKDSVLVWLDPENYWPDQHKNKRQVMKQLSATSEGPMLCHHRCLIMKPQQALFSLSQISTMLESTESVIEARVVRCAKLTDVTVQNFQFNKLCLTLTKESHHIAKPVTSKNSKCQFHKWCLKGHVPDNVACKKQNCTIVQRVM